MSSVNPMSPLRVGRFSTIIRWRVVLVCVVLTLGTAAMFTLSIAHGDYELSPGDVWRILSGSGSKIENRIVIDVRLGRALVGLLVGAALALAGALTQSVARNPLASPDVLGITQGASLAAVILLTFAHGGGSLGESADVILHTLRLPSAAVVGALIVATVVWLIAGSSRHSMVRFVLIGVAISTLCASLNTWIMSIGDLDQVASARLWLTGSLNGRDLDEVWAPLTVVLAAALASAYLSFHLAALTLGDTTATLLGHNVRVIQAVQLVFAVALSAIAVAAAGPIGFVAFVSPQVAMRLAGTPTPPLITSALTGALLVTSADFIARVVLPWELPVGIVTTIVGAPVLIYLIIKLNRKATR